MRLRMNIYPLRNALEVGNINGTNFFTTNDKLRINTASEFGYRPYRLNRNIEKWFDLYPSVADILKDNENFKYQFVGLKVTADFLNFVPRNRVLNSWHFDTTNGAMLSDLVVKDVASSVNIDTKEESKFMTGNIAMSDDHFDKPDEFIVSISRADQGGNFLPNFDMHQAGTSRLIAVYRTDSFKISTDVYIIAKTISSPVRMSRVALLISDNRILWVPSGYLSDRRRIEILQTEVLAIRQAIETLLKIPTEPASYSPKVELSTNEFEYSITTEFVDLDLLNQIQFSDSRSRYGFAIFDSEKHSNPEGVGGAAYYNVLDASKCYLYGILTNFQYDFPRGLLRFSGERSTLPVLTEGNGF